MDKITKRTADIRYGTVTPQELSYLMRQIPLIEDWCKAVRARMERELLDGNEVPGWKLVQGRKGPRKWLDEEAAERYMKDMRMSQQDMYNMKLISPTTAEKLFKDNPIRWQRLQEFVTQSEGVPSVAPDSDKREPLVIRKTDDDFDVIT